MKKNPINFIFCPFVGAPGVRGALLITEISNLLPDIRVTQRIIGQQPWKSKQGTEKAQERSAADEDQSVGSSDGLFSFSEEITCRWGLAPRAGAL
jgi:hypothetical protein